MGGCARGTPSTRHTAPQGFELPDAQPKWPPSTPPHGAFDRRAPSRPSRAPRPTRRRGRGRARAGGRSRSRARGASVRARGGAPRARRGRRCWPSARPRRAAASGGGRRRRNHDAPRCWPRRRPSRRRALCVGDLLALERRLHCAGRARTTVPGRGGAAGRGRPAAAAAADRRVAELLG